MGGADTSAADRGNEIAQATLQETQRQYYEQKWEKDQKKARDKANASANRKGTVFAYGNNVSEITDLTRGLPGGYSLLMGLDNSQDTIGAGGDKLGG